MLNKEFGKNIFLLILAVLFAVLFLLRLFFLEDPNISEHAGLIWAMIYNIVAIFGGISGVYLSRFWGGYKSIIGRAILAFSFGLFAQAFGQNTYNYFYLTQGFDIVVPYPSLGDIGFFGSVIFYIYGVFTLARASGIKISLSSLRDKFIALFIPIIMLVLSFTFFLQGYEFDWSNKFKVFLDFGYPLGQAFYVSIAILLFIVSRKVLGGEIKKPILFLLVALMVQYFSDFTFLYQSNKGIFVAGGIVDFSYFISYFTMSLAIIYIGHTFKIIKSENLTTPAVHPAEGDASNEKLFNQILVEIIKRQTRVGGQLAWEQVEKIDGVVINDKETVNVSISGDPKQIIDHLVFGYKSLFGDIAVEVSKSAVRYLIAELPDDLVPDSLK